MQAHSDLPNAVGSASGTGALASSPAGKYLRAESAGNYS
jgi:hypothetical protein